MVSIDESLLIDGSGAFEYPSEYCTKSLDSNSQASKDNGKCEISLRSLYLLMTYLDSQSK